MTTCSILGGWGSTPPAEAALLDLDPVDPGLADAGLAATVFVPGGEVALVVVDRVGELPEGARVFAFPGQEHLTGRMSVAELLMRSAIDDVVALGGVPVEPDAVIDTRDFVRPVVAGGRLVLRVRPYAGGGWAPFEVPDPTPCCADHAAQGLRPAPAAPRR